MDSEYWQIECPYDPPHTHEFPSDWVLGGPDKTDPRADARWRGSVYTYLDYNLVACATTQVPLCDDQALDEFTKVAEWGLEPMFLQATRPDKTTVILPWTYDVSKDLLTPIEATDA